MASNWVSPIWGPALVTFNLVSWFKLHSTVRNCWVGFHRFVSSLLVGVFACRCLISSNCPSGLVTLLTSASSLMGFGIA